jgi:vesicle-fusing ATPase
LGGLENLKDWLRKRESAFSKEAREYGLEKPKGFLAMGISGCGKSLTAKITASLWNLPLFRLDMNLVYSGMSGSPETVFSRALKTMDSVAPAVLWLDEIESGISDKHGEGSSSRILGFFLTWMQEHESEIFIAATANRIDLLPAELLRRGRFDQIFFIDLPTRVEREEIFSIHLKGKGNDPQDFNIPQLAQITKGWTGSEIEQVIISGMYEAFNENRKLTEDDLFVIFGNSVPLSITMEEQIKKIKSWAHNRAVPATKEKEY